MMCHVSQYVGFDSGPALANRGGGGGGKGSSTSTPKTTARGGGGKSAKARAKSQTRRSAAGVWSAPGMHVPSTDAAVIIPRAPPAQLVDVHRAEPCA